MSAKLVAMTPEARRREVERRIFARLDTPALLTAASAPLTQTLEELDALLELAKARRKLEHQRLSK